MTVQTNGRGLTLLAVLAHPDDETFGMGGTLALYARRGVAVHLVCGTRGEVGEMDPRLMKGFNSIGERREAELRCAAEKLGLAGVHFLDYRDSGMPGSADNRHPDALAAAPVDEVAGRIASFIRLLRPQVVVTFDPIGGYRHPDHIAIHVATVQAFHSAGLASNDPDPDARVPYTPQKLYFHTFSRAWLRAMLRVARLLGRDPRRWGTNRDIDMMAVAEVDFPIHASINTAPVAGVRDEAVACHASQGAGSLNTGIFALLRRWLASQEQFMRAFPAAPEGLKETDLFAGVVAD